MDIIKGKVVDHLHSKEREEFFLECDGVKIAVDVKGFNWLPLITRTEDLIGCQVELSKKNMQITRSGRCIAILLR